MTATRTLRAALGIGALLLSGTAWAHAGHEHASTGFFEGLVHPATGLDHLLAMVTVGLWAATLHAGRRWLAPALFIAAMAVGALAARTGLLADAAGAMEALVAGSVLLLGALLAAGSSIPVGMGWTLVVAAGLLHGGVHGLEAPAGASSFTAYVAGFVVATLALHLAGLRVGSWLAHARRVVLRPAGIGVGIAGAALLLTRI